MKARWRSSRSLTVILIILLSLSSILYSIQWYYGSVITANQGGFAGWEYRKSHVIHTSSGAGTNYQIPITVYAGSGTDDANNVYLANHARPDFGDVRFAASDGTTPLNYWMEGNFTVSNWSKYAGNPVLPKGTDKFSGWGSVVKNGTTYHMYYSYSAGDGIDKIGHATSSDGKSWTKDSAHNPVLQKGELGKFDDYQVWLPIVWIEGSTWYMLYTGQNSAGGSAGPTKAIGLAESTDGLTWTRMNSGNAVLTGTPGRWDGGDVYSQGQVEAGSIMKVGSTYYLYYNSFNLNPQLGGGRSVGIATSTDLMFWTKDPANPIMLGGRFCAGVFKRGSYYYLLVPHFTGSDDVSKPDVELYRDTSPTFYRSSRVFLGYPITRGGADAFDSGGLDVPFVLTDDVTRSTFSDSNNQLWVYYGGGTSSVYGGINPGNGGTQEGMVIEPNIDVALATGSHARFWVQVAGNLTASTQTIYVYYGKSDAASTSDGAKTFLAFNDFTQAPTNEADGAFKITDGTYLDTDGVGTGDAWHGPRTNLGIIGQSNFRFRYAPKEVADVAGLEREMVFLTDSTGRIIYSVVMGDYREDVADTQLQLFENGGTDYAGITPSGSAQLYDSNQSGAWSDGEFAVEILRSGSTVTLNSNSGLASGMVQLYSGDSDLTTLISGVKVTIQGYSSNPEIPTHEVNYFFLSKYVNPEPVQGTWGKEEIQPISTSTSSAPSMLFLNQWQLLAILSFPPFTLQGGADYFQCVDSLHP
jgi:hypothetical protein